jgi:periplasmic protein TonB
MARLADSRTILWLSAAVVAAAHAMVLFAWSPSPETPGVLLEEESPGGVEVELVASAEQASEEVPAPTEETPPTPPEPVEQPTPEPTPLPEEASPLEEKPEVLPEPQSTPAPQRPAPKPPTPKPKKSAASPAGKPNTSSQKTGLIGSGSPNVNASQASFAKRPSLIYPVESRQAREEGAVVLRITVDARGRPTNVAIIKGSGFPRLDRAAIEGAWRCRIKNAKAGTTLDVPLRFDFEE